MTRRLPIPAGHPPLAVILVAMILASEPGHAQPLDASPTLPAAASSQAAAPETPVGPDPRPDGAVTVNDPAAVTHGFLAAVDRDGGLGELAALDARRRKLELEARISSLEQEIAGNKATAAEADFKKRAADRDDPVAVQVGNQVVPVGRPPTPPPGFDAGDGRSQGEDLSPRGVPMPDPLPPEAIASPGATKDSGPVVVRVTGRGGALSAVVQLPSGRVVTVRAGDALPDDLGRIESVTPTRVMLRPPPKDGAASVPGDAKPLIFADELPNG